MGSEIASPVTQTETKRLLMPNNLLEAAIEGNETHLKQILGLNDEEQDHPPHTKISIEFVTPMEPTDCLIRSATGMENTILHILSTNGHENLVSTICMKDSSLLKARNVRNETPFHHAARFGHVKNISKLIEHAKSEFGEAGLKELLREKNCLGETTLHEAARHGHRDVVSALMEEDLELVGLVNNDFVSPLYLATARGSLNMVHKMVEKMLDHEITPSFYSGPKKQTALHAAVVLQVSDPELTKELLKLKSKEPLGKGADETGRTPLHFVASTGNHKIAELLLDKDPSLAYIQDSDGSFPVHTAVRMGHVKMIVLLLERCLDSGELLDGNGRNFLHIAIEAKKPDIMFKLLKDSKNKLSNSHWNNMFNVMVNAMDHEGNTPLHLAAKHGSIEFLDSLFEYNKLDLTLENKEGLTAFDISEIQLAESERKIKSRDLLCEYDVQNRRSHFGIGWFQYYTKEEMPKTVLIGGTIQDHKSTTDARGAKKSSAGVIDKAQLVGLGSVLIATVTFAAAFTLPGGTNQDTSTPIPARKYTMKAFVLADFSAFFLSFLSTLLLIYSATHENSERIEMHLAKSMTLFSIAAKCMVIALTLGLYMVLAPVGKAIVILISVFGFFLLVVENPKGSQEHYRRYYFRAILNHISEGNSRGKPKHFGTDSEILYIFYKRYVPIFAPLIFIFGFALL